MWSRSVLRAGWIAVVAVVGVAWMLAGCGAGVRPSGRLQITLRPSTVLIDTAPSVVIAGARAGEIVQVTAKTQRFENVWTATATFRANSQGVVDLAHDAPIGSPYVGAAALGLLGIETPGSSAVPRAGATVTAFMATANGHTVQATLRQRLRSSSVRVSGETVARDGFVGDLYLPRGGGARGPGVVVWGGSEGGLSIASEEAGLLASHGIPALGIAYFDGPGLPCALSDIPLEYFARAIRWMRRQPQVDPDRVWLLSASRGTEAEALMAAHFPGLVHGFVAGAPSSTAYGSFPGTCRPRSGAAWTLGGRPVPYACISVAAGQAGEAYNSRAAFLATLQTPRTRRAQIPLGRFRGPVLLLAGSDDQLWPSPIYSAQIMRELAHDPARHERRIYPGAGHLVLDAPSIPIPTASANSEDYGGSEAADDAAHRADWPLTIDFIRDN